MFALRTQKSWNVKREKKTLVNDVENRLLTALSKRENAALQSYKEKILNLDGDTKRQLFVSVAACVAIDA